MTPSRGGDRGPREHIRVAVGSCSLGHVLAASTDVGICAVLLGDDPQSLLTELDERLAPAELVGADEALDAVLTQVVTLVDEGRPAALQLDVRGTTFQRRVWEALRTIAPGSTVTYTELAHRIDQPRAVRAVASACGANPLAVVVPCHRVVRVDGGLGGYRWGLARKQALLDRERSAGGHARR